MDRMARLMIEHEYPIVARCLLQKPSASDSANERLDVIRHVIGRADVIHRGKNVRSEDNRLSSIITKPNRLLAPGMAGDDEGENARQDFRFALSDGGFRKLVSLRKMNRRKR